MKEHELAALAVPDPATEWRILGSTNLFRMTGDMLHLISVLIILHKMVKLKSCHGLSLKSQLLYGLVFACRYIPSFIVGHQRVIYLIVMKLFFLSTSWFIVFLMTSRNPWKATYDRAMDNFNVWYLIAPTIILAALFHYDHNDTLDDVAEKLWTFSQYLEAVAIVPQLRMLWLLNSGTSSRHWDILTGHYVFCLGMYRAFYIMNWIYRYHTEGRYNFVDTTAGTIQTLLFADFFRTYLKGMAQLTKEVLPI
eukprot:Hpha_TRINITY_DN36022_c0_g1::TRINITY_DN36022_c0_g1_i1::g.170797::m.170797/K10949/KDELR; ER lumen protein retaining receptor